MVLFGINEAKFIIVALIYGSLALHPGSGANDAMGSEITLDGSVRKDPGGDHAAAMRTRGCLMSHVSHVFSVISSRCAARFTSFFIFIKK